jgi:hypothetical protein
MIGSRIEVGGRNMMNSLLWFEVRNRKGNCGIEKSFDSSNGWKNKYIQTTCVVQHSLVRFPLYSPSML